MRYFIERFQGTPEGSQSTREATLSGAMRGILRSGRRGALKRDFVFASLFRNNIFIHEIPFIHKKTPAVTGVFSFDILFPSLQFRPELIIHGNRIPDIMEPFALVSLR